MLIFDQLKKNDAPLRLLSLAVVAGLLVLGGGLWWVQVVRGRDYQQKLQNQSYRTVRVPAPRGQILDRNHVPLAENQPSFNLSLYLEELSRDFKSNYNAAVSPYVKAGKKLKPAQRKEIAERTRYAVANNAVTRIANEINEPLPLDYTNFQKHFAQDLALPLPVLQNLTPNQIARVSEAADMPKGLDLEVQSVRVYPNATSSGHLLGYVRRDDSAADGESSYFSHYLPDWRGKTGIENNFDVQLRGTAGEKAVLVNNLGYRQSETIITPVEPGSNVVLTVDLDIQRAAENALASYGAQTRGAAVVMDVNTGDLLALASSPMLDSNEFARPISPQRWEQLSDERLRPQLNRAMHENYSPGSIFKPVIAMAALESGMNIFCSPIQIRPPNARGKTKAASSWANAKLRTSTLPVTTTSSAHSFIPATAISSRMDCARAWTTSRSSRPNCISASARGSVSAAKNSSTRKRPAISPRPNASSAAGRPAIPRTCASAKAKFP
jgi:penicillin-binding protein 2